MELYYQHLIYLVPKLTPNNFITNCILFLSYILPNIQIKFNNTKLKLYTVREIYLNKIFVYKNLNKINIPLLIFHSKMDKITYYKSSVKCLSKINSNDKKIFILNRGDHCLFNLQYNDDNQPYLIILNIISWIKKRI